MRPTALGPISFAAEDASAERVLKTPERGYVSIRQAERWEDGLMVGNGNIGATVQGYPVDDTIVFSHAKLFLPWWPPLRGDRLQGSSPS